MTFRFQMHCKIVLTWARLLPIMSMPRDIRSHSTKLEKESSDKVKPSCLKKSGTMYCICNTIVNNKDFCMCLADVLDKDELDIRNSKSVIWETLYNDYCSYEIILENSLNMLVLQWLAMVWLQISAMIMTS